MIIEEFADDLAPKVSENNLDSSGLEEESY